MDKHDNLEDYAEQDILCNHGVGVGDILKLIKAIRELRGQISELHEQIQEIEYNLTFKKISFND